jgi:hypothetical protein
MAFQYKDIETGCPETALAGCDSIGLSGIPTIVVKPYGADHALTPPAFAAFTRQ